ncbi:MAG TPA: anaerobic ribonucleoside-triphosphate reductase [archaeon]|nr:anaerobic ribonucleoside-triphosphate reductase [archaeon]
MTDSGELLKIAGALNSPAKIQIIKDVYEKGTRSITDVRNDLKLSFSTAHKYLAELEKAGILGSVEREEGGRRKKLYSLKEFSVSFSPSSIASKESPRGEGETLAVIDDEEKIFQVSVSSLREHLLKNGLPLRACDAVVEKLKSNAYPGITVGEIRAALVKALDADISAIENAKNSISSYPFLGGHSGVLEFLKQKGLASLAELHNNSSIYIRNTRNSFPIALVHNPLLIARHGLKILGLESRPAKRIDSFASHVVLAASAARQNLHGVQQHFPALNVFMAPFFESSDRLKNKASVENVLYNFKESQSLHGSVYTIGIETEMPKSLAKMPAVVDGKDVGVLGDFASQSLDLAKMFADLYSERSFSYPKLVLSARKKQQPDFVLDNLDSLYVANMAAEFQGEFANYSSDWFRVSSDSFDSSAGLGEMQMVSVNLPRIALTSKTEAQFFEELRALTLEVIKAHLASAEYLNFNRFTSLTQLSKKVGDDKYCDFEKGVFLMEVDSLASVSEIVTGSVDASFIKKTLQEASALLKKEERINIQLTEGDFTPLINRFTHANSRLRGGKQYEKPYSRGADAALEDNEKLSFLERLHPLLLGGHCAQFKEIGEDLFRKLLGSNVGMAASSKALWKV